MPLFLELALGADSRFDLPIEVDGATPAGGLDGWSFAFRVFAAETDPDDAALLALTSAGGAIVNFDSTAGIARLLVSRDDLLSLVPGRYWFRLASVDPAGHRDEPARGVITFLR